MELTFARCQLLRDVANRVHALAPARVRRPGKCGGVDDEGKARKRGNDPCERVSSVSRASPILREPRSAHSLMKSCRDRSLSLIRFWSLTGRCQLNGLTDSSSKRFATASRALLRLLRAATSLTCAGEERRQQAVVTMGESDLAAYDYGNLKVGLTEARKGMLHDL